MVAPGKFAHVAFNTYRYSEMIEWYMLVFDARVQHRDSRLAFLTYDGEHHRFAFINLGTASGERPPGRADGVHHLGYTWRHLEELIDTYMWLKSLGIVPARAIRHGMSLSLHYRDPDGNALEFQVDLMTAADADAFVKGPAFATNPIGEPFDPEAVAVRLAQGKPIDDLIFGSDQVERRAKVG
ncbi:VOC family protein [Bradyrhizobium diazoefficiens]|nr:VOC family protein [Bradyrhizobium diazoefficiens]MBR0846538.1 VOC family protein [Bradyrhizobium diazoefficiens]